MKLFSEGRLGACNLSILEVEAGKDHEFEANADNMAHLGSTINPVSRENHTPKPSKQNNSNNKNVDILSNVMKHPKFYLFV